MRQQLIVGVLLTAAALPVTAQQAPVPALSRQQRAAMQELVRAADTASSTVVTPEDEWPLHVLRASDGSHYIAFSLARQAGLSVARTAIVYVRLATRRPNDMSLPERSAVAEWLAGQSAAPVLPRRGLAFGEMPTYGAAGIGQRSAGLQAQNLQLLELERERAREKQEAQERARKAALEGEATPRPARALLPFEDFDLHAQPVADSSGTAVLRRSLTAGPGDYELIVAWMDADAGPRSQVHVAHRPLFLPAASSTGLALSSVIVADEVGVRDAAIPPTEQASHPYTIGGTEIKPASDHVLSPDERLALVVQVINARGNAAGKPDVEVGFKVFRRNGAREEHIGALAPQRYNELTLPLDFEVAKGHPIFAAVGVPLRTFKRGEYRMEISANDRIAGAGVTTDVLFTVAATPAALLAEAPPLAPAFDPAREGLPAAVSVMVGAIRASEGNDREAIAAWHAAIKAGADAMTLRPVMIDAALRLGDAPTAIDLARQGLDASAGHPRFTRQLARGLLMSGRTDEAFSILEAYLSDSSNDTEAQWLAMHALFSGFVTGTGSGATAAGRARLAQLATEYAAANGAHAPLAREWAAAVR